MRKSSIILLFLTGIFTGLFAQKTIKDANAQKRNVGNFHAIEIGDGIDLYLSGGEEAVAVSASRAEDVDRIMTRVENGVLKVWFESRMNGLRVEFGNRKLRAYISYKSLDNLKASGGSDVTVDGSIKSSKLAIHISGGSDFEGEVNCEDLSIQASGGSDVSIRGRSTRTEVRASGGSDFNGFGLVTDMANLDVSGGSDAEITVNKEITAEASGGSDIHYKGNGMIRDIKASGGRIKKVTK